MLSQVDLISLSGPKDTPAIIIDVVLYEISSDMFWDIIVPIFNPHDLYITTDPCCFLKRSKNVDKVQASVTLVAMQVAASAY